MDLTGSVGYARPCSAPGIAGATLAPSSLPPTFSIFHDPQRRRFAVGTWIVGYSGGGLWGGPERVEARTRPTKRSRRSNLS